MPPYPKRSTERRRANIDPNLEQAEAGSRVSRPEPPEHWHSHVVAMWDALAESGQAQFYESSDWQFGFLLMERMSRLLDRDDPAPAAWRGVDEGLARLLVTEGDRRRMRLELERTSSKAQAQDAQAEATISDIRRRLSS